MGYSRDTAWYPADHGYHKTTDTTKRGEDEKLMTAIAHASHHADHLSRAIESGNLPKGFSASPRMMLMFADDTTQKEWQEQTKLNTLGYVRVSERHHNRVIEKRKAEIADIQTQTLQAIDSS